MLTFSIVDMKIHDIQNIIEKGLGWPKEPAQTKKNINRIELAVQNGGGTPATGGFYHPSINEQKLVFMSNMPDGWDSLLYCITKNRSFEYLSFRIISGKFPLMEMHFVAGGETVRVIRAMKESKWDFYETGEPLWFENSGQYLRRRISERVNYELLLSYSKKMALILNQNLFLQQKEKVYG